MAEEGGRVDVDDDGRTKRTGTLYTASACIIMHALGIGILSLPWAIAQLGWIVGPSAIIIFCSVTYLTADLLSLCYRNGDTVDGERNYSYKDAVGSFLGHNMGKICGLALSILLFLSCPTCIVLGSMGLIDTIFRRKGGRHADSMKVDNIGMILIGVAQIILSQLSNLHVARGFLIVADSMPFIYSAIGLGLAISKVVGNGAVRGSLTGITVGVVRQNQKIWRSLQALGVISFAFSYSNILIDIQDTLGSPPAESTTMKYANLISVAVMSLFFMLYGGFGYAAFGDSTPENLLTGFGLYGPYWLILIGDIAMIIHAVVVYQACCQPLFVLVEKQAAHRFPRSWFFKEDVKVPLLGFQTYKLNLFRLVWRTLFVIITTLLAMLLPFFSELLGIIGSLGYWVLTIYFPVEMYIAQRQIPKWSFKWNFLKVFTIVFLIICIAGATGSVAGIIDQLHAYNPFKINGFGQ